MGKMPSLSTRGIPALPSSSCWVRSSSQKHFKLRRSLTVENIVDRLQPPRRDITSPLRFPISNVFKGQGSTTGVWGKVCSGLVQVGERLGVLPGDETAVVKGQSLSYFSRRLDSTLR
jgi:translation elongation factor EF-1alpha